MGGAAAWRRTAETVWFGRETPWPPPRVESMEDVAGTLAERVGSSYVFGPVTLMLGTRVREGKAAKAAGSDPAGARKGIVMANLLATNRER